MDYNMDITNDSNTMASPDHTNTMTRSTSHNRQNVNLFENISKDVSKINAKDLRVLVPQMFQLWRHPKKDIYTVKVKGIWHKKNKPHDFPNDVEFRDPNNKPKMSVEELRKVFVYLREKLHMPDVSLYPQADIGPRQQSEERDFHILTKCDDMIQAQEPVEDKVNTGTKEMCLDTTQYEDDDGGRIRQYFEGFCASLQPDIDYNEPYLVQPESICYDNVGDLHQLGIQEAQFDQMTTESVTVSIPATDSTDRFCSQPNAMPNTNFIQLVVNNTVSPLVQLYTEFQRTFKNNSPVLETLEQFTESILNPLITAAQGDNYLKCFQLSRISTSLMDIMRCCILLGPKYDPREKLNKFIENSLREEIPEDGVRTKCQNNVNTEQPIMTLHNGFKVCTNQEQGDFQAEPAVIPVSPMCANMNSLNLTQEQQEVDVEEDLNIEIPSKFQHAVDGPFITNQDIIDTQRRFPLCDKHGGSVASHDVVINNILEMEKDYSSISEKLAPEQLMQGRNANLIPLTVLQLEDLSDGDSCSPKPKRRCLPK